MSVEFAEHVMSPPQAIPFIGRSTPDFAKIREFANVGLDIVLFSYVFPATPVSSSAHSNSPVEFTFSILPSTHDADVTSARSYIEELVLDISDQLKVPTAEIFDFDKVGISASSHVLVSDIEVFEISSRMRVRSFVLFAITIPFCPISERNSRLIPVFCLNQPYPSPTLLAVFDSPLPSPAVASILIVLFDGNPVNEMLVPAVSV